MNDSTVAHAVAIWHTHVANCHHEDSACIPPQRSSLLKVKAHQKPIHLAMLPAGYGVGRPGQGLPARLLPPNLQNPTLAEAIRNFWFYDLRAKAADDVGDERGAQEATDLLGHDSQRTTIRHYRQRGTIVHPIR